MAVMAVASQALIPQSPVSSEKPQAVKLTKREIQVLSLVIQGKSSQQVATELFLSKRTVDFHLANVYDKLRVSNRVQALNRATRLGLIPYDIQFGD